MTKDESTTITSPNFTQADRRIIEQQQQGRLSMTDDNDVNDKSRKFRWSSCFSFISKLKKPKPPQNKIRTSQSFEDFDKKINYDLTSVDPNNLLPETIEVSEAKFNRNNSISSSVWKQTQQPPVSLSPPPRHSRSKRDSHITNTAAVDESTTTHRRLLIDPTLTPQVKPRSIKSKKQPSLLRLSLDAELLQQQASPDGVFSYNDNESISTTDGHSSLLSFTPTSTTQYQPFKSGTLGIKNHNKLNFSSSIDCNELPPLPQQQQQQQQLNIPLNSTNTSNSSIVTERPISTQSAVTILTSNSNISQQQQYLVDSPDSYISATVTDDDEVQEREKLTLKERRHRRSPLAMPDTDQLTLALKGLEQQQLIEQHEKKRSVPTTPIPSSIPLPPIKQQPRRKRPASSSGAQLQHSYKDNYYESSDEDDLNWRQQLLEQSIAFSFQNKSRQEAMLTLEGKKPHQQQQRAVSLQPIVNVHDLDDHFSNSDNERGETVRDVVQDKAQYDAIVSRTGRASQQQQQDDQFIRKSFYRTSLRARSASDSSSSSFNNKLISQQQQPEQLDIITENEVVHSTKTSKNNSKIFTVLTTTPETPPHHQLNAPSLISAPSTPNSIDSSVLDHEDYLIHTTTMTFVPPPQ